MKDIEENKQGCEVFFLAIGQNDKNSSQSGDAIVLTMGNRFSDNRSDYKIIVVDGAFTSDAETIREHLDVIHAKNKNGKLQIDLMISTHSDEDHISGLMVLVEDSEIEVKELWIHGCDGFGNGIQCSVGQAKDLIGVAKRKGVPMSEPFSDAGLSYNPEGIDACIEILGPTKEYYAELMSSKEKDLAPGKMRNAESIYGEEEYSRLTADSEYVFHNECLCDPDENATSNSNNSSTMLLLKFFQDGVVQNLVFLTADAGVEALERALPNLKCHGWYDEDVHRFIQIPHHGSRRNVGPIFLDKILGEREFGCERGTCFVSAHKKDKSHPKIQVINAFTRRGYRDLCSMYASKRYQIGAVPDIEGWNVAEHVNLLHGEEEEGHKIWND